MKHPKSKMDKAIDDWQEVLYSVLVEYQKEDTNEDNTNDNPKGDLVWWRDCDGDNGWVTRKVTNITQNPHGAYLMEGTDLEFVPVLQKDECVFDLNNHKWAWGYQIKPVAQQMEFDI